MMKRRFLPTPLLLGGGVVLLVVTVASVFAVDCSKKVRSSKMYESTACGLIQTLCSDNVGASCPERQAIKVTNTAGNTQRYFGTVDGSSADHAVSAGTVLCGHVWDCARNDNGDCTYGSEAISPSTGEPIKRTRTYYDRHNIFREKRLLCLKTTTQNHNFFVQGKSGYALTLRLQQRQQ